MKPNQERRFGKQLNLKQYVEPTLLQNREQKREKSKRIIIISSNTYLDKENNNTLVTQNQNSSLFQKRYHLEQIWCTKVRVNLDCIKQISDPQKVLCYKEDIFFWLLEKELNRKQVDPLFMQLQPEISEQQRLYVVDYLMKTCYSFKLKDETFHMAVELMDTFLSKQIINIYEIELLAITSLFIASKFEEIYPPCLERLLLRTSFTKSEVLTYEAKMLDARQFELIGNTTLQWLNLLYDQIDKEQKNTEAYECSKYILESVLLRTSMYQYKPSEVALGTLVVVQRWLRLPEFNFQMVDQLKVTDVTKLNILKIILRRLSCLFTQVMQKKDLFVNKKYTITSKSHMDFEKALFI